MPIRILDLLRSGFRRGSQRRHLPHTNCYVIDRRIVIIKSKYDRHGAYAFDIDQEVNYEDSEVEIGRVILDSWINMQIVNKEVPYQSKNELLNGIAEKLGFSSIDGIWEGAHLVSVGGGAWEHFRVIDEFAHIRPWRKKEPGIHEEGVGVEFICRREPELIGIFIKRAVDLLNDPIAFEAEVARQKTTDRKENLARRKWTKLKIEEQKPEQARQMAAHFSVGQRVRHTESDREGVVIRVDHKHHNGQGLVEAELEDGEIIKSMLILPWIEALEPAANVHDHSADSEESPDFAEDDEEFHVGQKVTHIVSGRSGVVRKVDKEAEHGMGVIEVKLEDGEVILTSCIAPDLDRIA